MKNKWLAVFAVIVAFLVASGPLLAHHSTASYDTEHLVTFTGTITGFRFTNPHVTFEFEVTDKSGNVVKWSVLTGPPQRLYRAGWNTNTLKPGDRVTITGAPNKEGRKEMGLGKLVGPAGQELKLGAE